VLTRPGGKGIKKHSEAKRLYAGKLMRRTSVQRTNFGKNSGAKKQQRLLQISSAHKKIFSIAYAYLRGISNTFHFLI